MKAKRIFELALERVHELRDGELRYIHECEIKYGIDVDSSWLYIYDDEIKELEHLLELSTYWK